MRKYAGDFETTTDPEDTRVWSWGVSEIGEKNSFEWGKDIDSFLEWCKQENKIIYFHNLKFDGEFIIYHLLSNGYEHSNEKRDKTFSCIISRQGQFYQIEVIFKKKNKKYEKVTFLDSLKKLPFPVSKIAKDFKLPMLKLEIDYKKPRPIDYEPTKLELDYLRNDVQIVAAALHIQFEQGLEKMTVGSDALHNFKEIINPNMFKYNFPVLPLPIDNDIRKAYKGGFTYLHSVGEREVGEGCVFDVNSLYPSVMYDSPLPYGMPQPFSGQYETDNNYPLYVQKLVCEFKIKPDKIPTIQIKNSRFADNEYLRESGGEPATLTLTSVDLHLFFEHYTVDVLEWVGGWKFRQCVGVFKPYVDEWMRVKEENAADKNALYVISKLMMNSLYGKFGTHPDVTGKYPILEDGHVRYLMKEEEMRDPVYIPMGCFITAWARYKTITTAQKVYHRFVYADTDSIHLVGKDIPENIEVHNSKLGAWKHEGNFTRARFIRQKTYIEEIGGKLHVTCAGMPDAIKETITWENFHSGFTSFGKLTPKHVKGGIVLQDSPFTIKSNVV